MIEKTKKRKLFSLASLFVIVGLFFPLRFAWALSWLPKLTVSTFVNVLFGQFVMLSIAWVELCELYLRFILSPRFISLAYTTNDFVTIGWTITRDFANMFFIVILVIIGLATALRLREYEWQKTLPRLILIALLINFTPVILGLIIDASNIAMNFFVQGISEETIFYSKVTSYLAFAFDITQQPEWMEVIMMPVFYIGFNFIAGVMYLLYAILLTFRYVALWTLVILSPIAFVSYILPGTKQLFSMWWKQFIQWCLIGVFATFFIYLADQLLYLVINNPGFINEGEREGWSLINSLMPYFVVIAFLFVGFFVSITFAPQGTNALFSAAKGGMMGAGKTAKGMVKGGIKSVGRGGIAVGRGMSEETGQIIQRYRERRVAFGDSKIRAAVGAARERLPIISKRAGKAAVSVIVGQNKAARDIGKAAYKGAFGGSKKERPTCSNCGNYVPTGAAFCPHCKKVMPRCSGCNERIVAGTKFCQHCGTPT